MLLFLSRSFLFLKKLNFEPSKRWTCNITYTPFFLSISAITFDFSKIQSNCDNNLVNKTLSDIMNAAVSHKIHAITFSDRITWRKIIQIQNFIMENNTRNLKFFMFHANFIDLIETYKHILRKLESDSVVKLVCYTRIRFCGSYLLCLGPEFWMFCKSYCPY